MNFMIHIRDMDSHQSWKI